MCMRVTCNKCGRPTFSGCGKHIEQVLGNVPAAERCECRAKTNEAGATSGTPSSFLRRILGL